MKYNKIFVKLGPIGSKFLRYVGKTLLQLCSQICEKIAKLVLEMTLQKYSKIKKKLKT